ncbi:hypothetical protein [Falsibacillus albus]|nr:hypothetical protein [Falsibacillus albus]
MEGKPVHFDGSLHSEDTGMEHLEFELTEEARKLISGNPYFESRD